MSEFKLRSQIAANPGGEDRTDQLEEIREILLTPDRKRLDRLDERVRDPRIRSGDVSEVFVEALRLRDEKDQGVTAALTPRIEAGLREMVRRNPGILTDILFPILGPMIRKSISQAFQRLLESLNQALEHSFTLRGLRWRWEAWRSGRPFSEVVLLHTLEFRVEQVFLIHSESGLLIDHAALDTVVAENPDLVSGMFTALRDFVKDSFRVDETGSVGELEVGDLTIWAEAAPFTSLAAVIRGTPPRELRDLLQETSEKLHRRLGNELAAFDGGHAVCAETQPFLQACLLQKKVPSQPPVLAWSVAGILLLAGLVLFGFFGVSNALDAGKFENFLDALKREPGIVITEAERSGGRFRVVGLRDPLAVDPGAIARASEVAESKLDATWKSYYSTDDAMVVRRAQTTLQAPESIRISVSRGILSLAGFAEPDWVTRTRDLIPLLPGVVAVDDSGLSTLQSPWFFDLKESAEAVRVYFEPGSRVVSSDEASKLQPLAATLKQLLAGAQPRTALRVEVLGMSDSAGESEFNQRLSQDRAEAVKTRLLELGVEYDRLFAIGQGEGESEFSARRVTVQIVVAD